MKKVSVLVVDDSPSMRLMLVHVLESDPRIQVIGTVGDGQAAIDFIAAGQPKPDVVLMDIHMPRLDGFEATRHIMETRPLPIVICTATADPRELVVAFRSMEAGALACVEKPTGIDDPEYANSARNLQQTICLMAEVKVVRRWGRTATAPRMAAVPPKSSTQPRLVGIGASTGGPPVLQTILAGLPRDFAAPLVIVQHIARGFLPGMVDWLNQTTGIQVRIASHGTVPEPGHAYIAPDDFHLTVSAAGRMLLTREAPVNGLRPSVACLFRSLAENLRGNAIGVLLTGMGKDGAVELGQMREAGAFTIAQDRDSSVVHGMPGEAIAIGAAARVLPADRIAHVLVQEIEGTSLNSRAES